MKAQIDIRVTSETLAARVVDRDVEFFGPNRVVLQRVNGTDLIAAIGDDTGHVSNATVVELGSGAAFDPRLTAGVVGYLGLLMWDRLHPGWRGPLVLLGHADVRVSIEGYATVDQARRSTFAKAVPYRPNLTWWVEGERIRA